MNREAFKLARDTLRKAVKDYGYRRTEYQCTSAGQMRTEYRHGPGKFEGEHWSIVHWHEAMLNGGGDEPLMSGEDTVADLFEVSDVERAAFMLSDRDQFAVLWYSEQGFVSLEYVSAAGYDELRAQNSEDNGETLRLTAPSAWASYLINGDASGLEDNEQAQCDAWIASLGYGAPTDCEDAGFITWHDARPFCSYAADCQTYTFITGPFVPKGN